tara:strand:+ start:252 stop:416 length:165 start_codon:yes stop_codon:yes gene_type:complete
MDRKFGKLLKRFKLTPKNNPRSSIGLFKWSSLPRLLRNLEFKNSAAQQKTNKNS